MACWSYRIETDTDGEWTEYCDKKYNEETGECGHCWCQGDEMRCDVDPSNTGM